MSEPNARKRVTLTRSIILGGRHAEAGSTHEVPPGLAHRLVGEGSAEHAEGEEKPTSVNRMQQADHGDPHTKQVAPAPAKGEPKK